MRRFLKWVRSTLFFLILTLVVGELVLQLAGSFVHDRGRQEWRAGAEVRVLCVGDSHTYGAGVPEPDSYPAHLQRLLDERAPRRYAVLNLGVPGMNTTQVLNRLPLNVARFHPDVLVVWCGINDAWNNAEVDSTASVWRRWIETVGSRSRLYRLLRVWLHDRKLARDLRPERAREGTRFRVTVDRLFDPRAPAIVHWGSGIEAIHPHVVDFHADDAMEQRAATDYAAMVEYARAADLPIIFVTYPLDLAGFAVANKAVRRVAQRYGTPTVESPNALQRVPKEKQIWGWAAHPTGPIYEEIARAAADEIVRIVQR